MFAAEIVALVTQLTCADPATCDRAGLADLVTTSQHVRGWLDALDARIAVHASRLAAEGSCEPAATLLAGGGRRSTRDAEAAARRGELCAEMPAVHDALAAGAVSAGHVDAIAHVAGRLDDTARTELKDLQTAVVGSATAMPVEAFEREMRQLERILSRDDGITRLAQLKQQRRVRRWVDKVTGMCHTLLSLDPETDARVAAALDAAVATERARHHDDDIDFDHLQADALVALITGVRSTDPRVPEITLLIDHTTLRHGPHDESVCETGDGQTVPVETVRRLGCDAAIVPIVIDSDGVPLHHGRTRRLASRSQHRALRAMYRTCGHPHCTVRFEDCRLHHVTWWEHLGTTNLDNLLPLCERHHHLVHERGWTLTIKPDRTITLRRPDGSLHYEGVTTDHRPHPGSSTPPTAHDPADDPRPGESEIPLHLRRAARRTRTGTTPAPPAAPDDETRPGETEIPLHLRRAARRKPAGTPRETATATPPSPASTTSAEPADTGTVLATAHAGHGGDHDGRPPP